MNRIFRFIRSVMVGLFAACAIISLILLIVGTFQFVHALIEHRAPTELESICIGFVATVTAFIAGVAWWIFEDEEELNER